MEESNVKLAAAYSQTLPEGWMLVPVVPTNRMIGAGGAAAKPVEPNPLSIYSAMLAASPAAPVQIAPAIEPQVWSVIKELREHGLNDMVDRLELSYRASIEDVYEQCADAIRPLVDRGLLPGSVVESVQIMVKSFALAAKPAEGA